MSGNMKLACIPVDLSLDKETPREKSTMLQATTMKPPFNCCLHSPVTFHSIVNSVIMVLPKAAQRS
jgi:hypothetical protein